MSSRGESHGSIYFYADVVARNIARLLQSKPYDNILRHEKESLLHYARRAMLCRRVDSIASANICHRGVVSDTQPLTSHAACIRVSARMGATLSAYGHKPRLAACAWRRKPRKVVAVAVARQLPLECDVLRPAFAFCGVADNTTARRAGAIVHHLRLFAPSHVGLADDALHDMVAICHLSMRLYLHQQLPATQRTLCPIGITSGGGLDSLPNRLRESCYIEQTTSFPRSRQPLLST